jgi:hypothetical protein
MAQSEDEGARVSLLSSTLDRGMQRSPMACAVPTMFVVVDKTLVREPLGALICDVGWRAETFPSSAEFLSRQPASGPSCLMLGVDRPQ